MNFKSIFCNHDFEYKKIILPNETERIKKTCKHCEKSVVYCLHDYREITKTHVKPTISLEEFEGSLYALKELSRSSLAEGRTEILFKCALCGELHKVTLDGNESK